MKSIGKENSGEGRGLARNGEGDGRRACDGEETGTGQSTRNQKIVREEEKSNIGQPATAAQGVQAKKRGGR